VAIESASLSLNELRNFVAQTLPEYMIPADFIFIDELPLSPNGKVDRQALLRLKPLISHPESSSVRTVGNPVEEVLRDVWADILHLEQVGLYDNFYKLGGDSLAAIRILSNIQEIFNVNVTLRSLLEVTTVAKQAELLSDLGHTCDQDVARIARLFLWLDQLSENEVERFLAERDAQSTDV
jgi:acyl carrier protein